MKKAFLIQSLPVEGKIGLNTGGFTYTMTAKQLIDCLKNFHEINESKSVEIIGVGATDSLGDEITYMEQKLYRISGENGIINTSEVDLNTKISFSQIAVKSISNSR